MTRKFTFTILAMLFAILGPGAEAWGQETQTWTWTASSGDLGISNEAKLNPTLNGKAWNFSMTDDTYIGWSSNHIQLGSRNNPSSATLSTSAFSEYTIKKITVVGYSYNGLHTYTFKVGENVVASGNTSSSSASIVKDNLNNSGDIEISLLKSSSSRALYIKSITIEYTESTPSTVAAPTFNPAGGEYVGEQTVEISTETEDATIYYNFTGEEPWTEYTKPVTISQTSTLYAYATKTDCEDSEIVSAEYTISSTITLNAPALTITAGNAKVTPTWAAVEHASSYTIEYATNNEFTNSTTITNAVSGTDITGLTNETTYYFRIKAIGDETYLTSGWSATVSATPSAVVTMSIDFESESSTYTDWTFSNMTSKQSNITAHGGSYIGTTGGKETASITTKYKIINPLTFTCYVSKASNNTTSSNWKVQISSDGSSWTDVKTQSATSMSQGEWVEISQDLSVYHNVYVRIYYTGSSAIRTIDDLTLTYAPAEYYAITIDKNIQNGTVEADKETATVGEIVTLTAEPNSSFILGEWNVTYIDGESQTQNITVTDNTFTMPAFPVTVSATFVERPAAAFTDGVYTESFASEFGPWITYSQSGDQVWNISNGYAHINGYSGGAKDNIDWLISPKMTAENAKLIVNFISKLNYSNQNSSLVMKYSTNYNGTGEPTTATWNELSPTIATLNTDTNSGDIEIEAASCYVAFIYTSTSAGAGEYFIKNFNAKQCYTVTYNANNGSGEMTDTNSPYTVGAEVTTLKNTFTAPAATPNFAGWNTEADGTGYSYNEEANFNMPAENVILYAQWSATVSYTITIDDEIEHGTVEADKAAAEVGETVTLTITPDTHYQLDEIIAITDGIGDVEITDEYTFIMPEDNVTIMATFALVKCNVSFSVNGNTTSIETIQVQEGSAIGSALPSSITDIPAGFNFAGWSTAESSTSTIDGTHVVNATETLFAVFSRIEGGSGETTWNLVTNSSEIVAGKVIKIAATVSGSSTTANNGTFAANGTISSSIMGKVSATISDNKLTNDEGAAEFTIGGTSGNWTLAYGGKLLGATAVKKLAYDNGTTTWSISIDENAKASIANGTTSYGTILYNRDTPRFTTYTSTTSASMVLPQIFVKTVSGTLHYYTRVYDENTKLATLTVNGPSIIMNGYTLTVTGSMSNTNPANLIIEDDGQLIHHNAGVAATVKKNITGYTGDNDNYYLIANPTDNTTVANLTSNEFDLYTFNPAGDGNGNEWINMKNLSMDVENGIGYLYANSIKTTLEFAGNLTPAGSSNIELTYANAGEGFDFPGFNLIGNPFACNAYPTDGNGNFMPFYKTNETGSELTLVKNVEAIAPCEGFFVEAEEDGQTVVITTEESEVESSALSLTVSQNRGSVIDRAIVSFNGSANLHKFMLNPSHTNLSIAKDGETFAAVSSETKGELPVSFKAETTGTYTISVNTENVTAGYIHLIDNMTGTDVDLLATPSYTFIGSPRDNENRFTLKFEVSYGQDGDGDEHFAYQSGSELVVNGEGTLQIFDILGRVVISEEVHGQTVNVGGLNTGAYIVRLTGESVKTQKIVVR